MADLYEKLIRPAMFRLPAETAHELGLEALRVGLGTEAAKKRAEERYLAEPFGVLERFGLSFRNPLGVAAGFDKNAKVVDQLGALGFGFVEVGTVTYRAQPGNPKPRLFRLPADGALLNRLGFNNEGALAIAERLRQIDRTRVLGVNIGRNKDVPNEQATDNYLRAFELVHPVADYIAINVSSPNTPGLRELQQAENLDQLLGVLQARNRELGFKPILIKISPDMTGGEIESILDICTRHRVSGIIATNTTVSREDLTATGVADLGSGGISGRPLAAISNNVISTIYRISKGKMPVIGVGGIFTPRDAFEKIAAGACLLQAYTGFVYKGPSFAREINTGLADIIRQQGLSSLDDAIGSAQRR